MAAPSSIVDFIPQSGTMNLATATNVVFHYFLYFSSPWLVVQDAAHVLVRGGALSCWPFRRSDKQRA